MRTQVVIIGAGPAGLLLGQLLARAGVDAIVLEQRSREHVLGRIRAGVLESGTVDVLTEAGVGRRLRREGLVHDGFEIAADGERLRIDLKRLGGRHVTVYGQTEVTRDLIEAREASAAPLHFDAPVTAIEGIDGPSPRVHATIDGRAVTIEAAAVAGCDGFHGIARASIPQDRIETFEKVYPFGWLGLLADVPPIAPELVYVGNSDGFALCSMRSATRSRYYVQVPLGERVEDWSAARFFDDLARRVGPALAANITRGPALEMSIAPLRSFVAEPMRHGRLFLAGDAAHIVPPTGAKGLNLAASDVVYLADGLIALLKRGDERGIDAYSGRALARVWRSVRFSWWMTTMLHAFPDDGGFGARIRRAEFEQLVRSDRMQAELADAYCGAPY